MPPYIFTGFKTLGQNETLRKRRTNSEPSSRPRPSAFDSQGKITAQGKLLLQDRLQVAEASSRSSKVERSSSKERRVFLFEQIIIFSEVIEKRKNNMSSDGYVFKNSIKINKMGLETSEEDEEEMKFTLVDKTPASDLKLVCQASTDDSYKTWTSIIRTLLDIQGDFLRALQSPIAYQKELTKENPEAESFQPMLLRKTNSQPHPSKSSLLIPSASSSSSSPGRGGDAGSRSSGFFGGKKQESLKYSRTRSMPSSKQTSSSMKPPKSPHFILGDAKKKSTGSPQKHTIIDGIRSTLLSLRSKSQEDLHRAVFSPQPVPENPKMQGIEKGVPTSPTEQSEVQNLIPEKSSVVHKETHFPVTVGDSHVRDGLVVCPPLNGKSFSAENNSRSPTFDTCPFVDQPLANISVDLGGTTEMTCHFGNLSTPANVEWFGPDDSLVIPCDTLSIVPLDENGYSKLQLSNVTSKQEGIYRCTASTSSSAVSTSARLTVVPPAKTLPSSPLSPSMAVSTSAG